MRCRFYEMGAIVIFDARYARHETWPASFSHIIGDGDGLGDARRFIADERLAIAELGQRFGRR